MCPKKKRKEKSEHTEREINVAKLKILLRVNINVVKDNVLAFFTLKVSNLVFVMIISCHFQRNVLTFH